jgi:hypothetical protein
MPQGDRHCTLRLITNVEYHHNLAEEDRWGNPRSHTWTYNIMSMALYCLGRVLFLLSLLLAVSVSKSLAVGAN